MEASSMGSGTLYTLLGNHCRHTEEICSSLVKDGAECSDDLACALSGCGLADAKNREEDARTRSSDVRKLGTAVIFCLIFIAVEVAGGLISHSLAVLTDAAHLLSDVAGFAISLFAIWASSWEATPRQSYGFHRLEILGALLSIQLIWLLTGIIVYEAIYRMIHVSKQVDGRLMFFVATFGFFVNVIMVFLLGHHHGHSHGHHHAHGHMEDCSKHVPSGDEHGQSEGRTDRLDHDHDHHDEHIDEKRHLLPNADTRFPVCEDGSYKIDVDIKSGRLSKAPSSKAGNINVKGAWLHVVGDLIQSVGVMIGGAIIWVKPDWKVVDLICTLIFSVIVLSTTVKILRDIMEVLMESTPREVDAEKLEKGLCDIAGVVAIHDLHVWAITVGKTLLACHVTIYSDADADAVLQRVIGYCNVAFNITHVTFQIERQPMRSVLCGHRTKML